MLRRVDSARFRATPQTFSLGLSELSLDRQGRGAAAAGAAACAPFPISAGALMTSKRANAQGGRLPVEGRKRAVQRHSDQNIFVCPVSPGVPTVWAHQPDLQRAEGVGFEPTVPFTARSISSRVP